MTVLFIFLDGVGLGSNDPLVNPFVRAEMPNLRQLLDGQGLIYDSAPFSGTRASLIALDATLGVDGLPQSATGQAVLLTGLNVPFLIGYHYGPKPDKATAAHLFDGGIFGNVSRRGKKTALINAYPPGYFQGIDSGKRLYSSIPLAITRAGLPLFTVDDLMAGNAMSADFTGAGWRDRMGMPEIPAISLREAGIRLAGLSEKYEFAFFEYWLTDYAGHGQNMEAAIQVLEQFDEVLGGLLSAWKDENLILITSDHGNIEDLSTRRHTANSVPLLLIGDKHIRDTFNTITDLTGVAPAIMRVIG
jgi:predicted AlkP superfamily pyrophosphatase or phosphodiesterase